jgi:hypothetical protein
LGYTNPREDSSVKTSYRKITDSINKRFVQDINNQLRVANAIFTFGTDVDSRFKENVILWNINCSDYAKIDSSLDVLQLSFSLHGDRAKRLGQTWN